MKKYLALIALISCVAVSLCGCNQEYEDHVTIEKEPTVCIYGFGEPCADYNSFIQINSFEISDSYGDTVATEDNESGSGYYVILGVKTNLIEHDFTHPQNEIYILFEDENERIFRSDDLEFVLFDVEKKELVYEIPYDERINYERFCSLKVSDGGELPAYHAFVMELRCFKANCFYIENNYYSYRCILIELAPE